MPLRIPTRAVATVATAALAAGALTGCGSTFDSATALRDAPAPRADAGLAMDLREIGAQDLIARAQREEGLNRLLQTVATADLVGTLVSTGPFTVFAPSDAAFDEAREVVQPLLEASARRDLANVLAYHVVPRRLNAADLTDGMRLRTAQGGTLTVAVDGDTVTVDGVRVERSDLEASNGVMHIIGGVLDPET